MSDQPSTNNREKSSPEEANIKLQEAFNGGNQENNLPPTYIASNTAVITINSDEDEKT